MSGFRICMGVRERNAISRLWIITLCAAAPLFCAGGARAAGTPIPHGTLELLAEKQWIAAGRSVNLGLRFELEKGWHVYWVNPGDSGEPPRVTWELPRGVTAGAIEWPAPRRLGTASIVDYGYEDAVTLIVPMRVDASVAATGPIEVGAEVKVLVCREMCIPGKAHVSLTLPVKSTPPAADARSAAWISEARESLPQPAPANWKFSVADANGSFVLAADVGHRVTEVSFFPLAESQISNAAPQLLMPDDSGFRLTLAKSDQLLKPIERFRGVIVLSGERAYTIDVPVGKRSVTNAKGPA